MIWAPRSSSFPATRTFRRRCSGSPPSCASPSRQLRFGRLCGLRWRNHVEEVDCLSTLPHSLGWNLYSAAHALRVEGKLDGTTDLVWNEIADSPGAVPGPALRDDRGAAGLDPFEEQHRRLICTALQAPADRDAALRRPQCTILRSIGNKLVQYD